MQRQRGVEVLVLDVGVDLAVGVAGEVGDDAALRRPLVEAFDRHDREHLVDRPDVGHRLEDAEVDEVLVDQPLAELVEQWPMALLVVGQPRLDRMRDRIEQVVDARTVDEVDLAERVQARCLRRGSAALPVNSSTAGRAWATRHGSRAGGGSPPGSSSCTSGTRPSGAVSTSDTLATSTAWCAVIARPHSVTMRGAGRRVLDAGIGQQLHDARRVLAATP